MKKPMKCHRQIKALTKVPRITKCWKCWDVQKNKWRRIWLLSQSRQQINEHSLDITYLHMDKVKLFCIAMCYLQLTGL